MTGSVRAAPANHHLRADQCDGWRLAERERLWLRQERIPQGGAEIARVPGVLTLGSRIRSSMFYPAS